MKAHFGLQSVKSDNRFQGWRADTPICTDTDQAVTSSAVECDPNNQVYRSASRNSWTGVTCNPRGGVICLHLAGLGLNGNAESLALLKDLPHLAYLNLEGNEFSGKVFSVLIRQAKCRLHVLCREALDIPECRKKPNVSRPSSYVKSYPKKGTGPGQSTADTTRPGQGL